MLHSLSEKTLRFREESLDGWVGGGGARGVESGGNFFKFLFYNNFHKILYQCVSVWNICGFKLSSYSRWLG